MRVRTDGQIRGYTDAETQISFIISPMLYAIAMGRIIIIPRYSNRKIPRLSETRSTASDAEAETNISNRVQPAGDLIYTDPP